MLNSFYVKMFFILVLCPVLLAAGVQMLTIDSQLGTSIEDCFDRVSIGEQLPQDVIYRNVTELTTRECEQICKQDKQCQSYDYGVGAKGNATCDLGNLNEKELKDKSLLKRHPDYDVYVRRFQCEQSPPSPIQPQFDSPESNPEKPEGSHRPIFRPDDEKFSDDYLVSTDLRPYGPGSPSSYRPDEYTNLKPDNDGGPSYGSHKPQDIPYKPDRPKPSLSYNSRPGDELQFQDYGNRNPNHYVVRPTRRPYQIQEEYKPRPDPYSPNDPAPSSGYGQNDDHSAGPIGPPDKPYRPNRPYQRPGKPYNRPNSQYTAGYGQNPQNDHSIYLEIYDPPRPYKPVDNPYGFQGYGTYSSQNPYGSGTITEIGGYDHNRPFDNNRPDPLKRPQNPNSSNFDNDEAGGYGLLKPQKPFKRPLDSPPNQASYGGSHTNYGSNAFNHANSQTNNHQVSHDSNQQSYGSSQSSQSVHSSSYGQTQSDYESTQNNYGNQGTYGNDHTSPSNSYGGGSNRPEADTEHQRPQKPSQVRPSHTYGSNQESFENNQSSYSSSHHHYNTDHIYGSHNRPSHHLSDYPIKPQNSYNNGPYGNQNSYGSHPSHDSTQSSYGSGQGSYGSNQDSYGSGQGSYGTHQADYGSGQASYGNSQASYGSGQGSYGTNQNAYGNGQGSFGTNNDAYGSGQGSYGTTNQDAYGSGQGSYGTHQADYGNAQGSYSSNQGSYGTSQTSQGSIQTSYGGSLDYTDNRPQNDDRYSIQHKPKPSYDPQQPISNQYGTDSDGYNKPANGSNYPAYTGVKPVYEYETDRPNDVPSYIARPGGDIVSSKPVVVGDYQEKPGYREPGKAETYEACFRRVLAGRRALRSNVRKAIPCERLEDCRIECATEIRFPCESFNYRLDRTFRGKGLCELMTKPIEAFDLRRDFVDDKDYDFYELDRNSLEPNCPDTLRGPGMLHSGYLSSKADRVSGQNGWRDRNDWFYTKNDRYGGSSRYNRRGSGNRYHEDRNYVPYQIGLSHSNDDHENWGQYGGYYGGYDNYYKDTKDYHNSINHWRLTATGDRSSGVRPITTTIEDRRSYVKPISTFDYSSLGKSLPWTHNYGYGSWKRGRWENSGLAWSDYEFNHHEIEGRSDEIDTRDCSSRRRPGMSLGSGAIRRSLNARNVVDCESSCFAEKEFRCVSYSYRYSNSHGSDNCFLSERPYRGLEMSADSGSDVYAMPQDKGCVSINYKPWVESECFWHVRSGAVVSDNSASAALTVAGLGACEAECLRANGFFCRGFSFRFESPAIGDDLENCILTSSPPTSLEVNKGLRLNPGHELYARGNYGRGCEPALYDDTKHRNSECYLQYDSASKLTGLAIRGQASVKDEKSCGAACTDAPFRCLSFSYNNNSPPDVDNCFLSEIRLFDLQKGVDYVHSVDDWLFAFDLFNGQCWRKVSGKGEYALSATELPHPIPLTGESYSSGPVYHTEPSDPVYIPGFKPDGSVYKPYSSTSDTLPYKPVYTEPNGPGFKPAYSVEPSRPVYLDDADGPDRKPFYSDKNSFKHIYEIEPAASGYKPDYPASGRPGHVPDSNYKPGFNAPFNDRPYVDRDGSGYKPDKPGYFSSGPDSRPLKPHKPVYHNDREENTIAVSWQHYSVSGFPCRVGTTCAQNQVAGHWACEPEAGEIGSWDYCCAPTHRCGYSEGFDKPWCYVGPTKDQWRPCSEKYYPYHQHNEPHPSQGHRESHPRTSRPWNDQAEYTRRPQGSYLSEADRKYWDELYRNGPKAYYDKYGDPLPGYARVPMSERPHIKYSHNYRQHGGDQWVQVPPPETDRSHYGLGAPRYWPVAYLHKGPPPNVTYFRYNETHTTTETPIRDLPAQSRDLPSDIHDDKSNTNGIDRHKDSKKRNISDFDENNLSKDLDPTKTVKTITTEMTPVLKHEDVKTNYTDTEVTKKPENSSNHYIDGIDDKLVDFTRSIEIFDFDDAKKHDKPCATLEAEERQIEEIGRLVASRREGKLVLEQRSEKELESKNIAVGKDLVDFNFGNHFPSGERRGIVQKVTKDEIENERNADRSLEVSETTYVRPPRVLSTTENIRKTVINGKVYYDATIREQRDLFSNSTRRSKSLRPLEERAPSVITSSNFGKKKVIIARNVNPVRRVRRVYKKRYNPEEVRRRLLSREKNQKASREIVNN